MKPAVMAGFRFNIGQAWISPLGNNGNAWLKMFKEGQFVLVLY